MNEVISIIEVSYMKPCNSFRRLKYRESIQEGIWQCLRARKVKTWTGLYYRNLDTLDYIAVGVDI